MDAGAGRTLSLSLAKGNGHHRREPADAIECGGRWADTLDLPRNRLIMRFDGKCPGVPALAACFQASVTFVTRWAQYKTLSSAANVRRMAEGVWRPVADSGGGPDREALDLGTHTVFAAEGTRTDENKPFPAVDVRLVVTRYPATKKQGAGGRNNHRWRPIRDVCYVAR
jgi:hypothetical protein